MPPRCRTDEERDHGEFRTKRLVLTTHGSMKALGMAYETSLSPPPAGLSLCHITLVTEAAR
jgi:hypothetical protein